MSSKRARTALSRITGNDNVRYLRVSTKRQVRTDFDPEGISLPAQREKSQEREAELNSTNVAEFIDPGRSATTIDKRKEFQDMIAYLKEHPNVRHVMVYSMSRFARNRIDDAVMTAYLQNLGVTLISATERNIDNTPAGRALHGFMAVVNQLQSEMSGEDIAYKMGQKAKKGGTLGPTKLGYQNARIKYEQSMVAVVLIDEKTARYVRLAFELYATGSYSELELRDELTDAGLLTPRRNGRPPGPISIHKLGTMLADRYYIGYVTYKGNEYKGRHEPLIDQKLFNRVQDVIAEKDPARVNEPTTTTSRAYCGAVDAQNESSSALAPAKPDGNTCTSCAVESKPTNAHSPPFPCGKWKKP